MEKVKRSSLAIAAHGGPDMEHSHSGEYVLFTDYARLEGLAREMADWLVTTNVVEQGNHFWKCLVCKWEIKDRTEMRHAGYCIIGKCETFLAGGI